MRSIYRPVYTSINLVMIYHHYSYNTKKFENRRKDTMIIMSIVHTIVKNEFRPPASTIHHPPSTISPLRFHTYWTNPIFLTVGAVCWLTESNLRIRERSFKGAIPRYPLQLLRTFYVIEVLQISFLYQMMQCHHIIVPENETIQMKQKEILYHIIIRRQTIKFPVIMSTHLSVVKMLIVPLLGTYLVKEFEKVGTAQ